VPIGFSGPLCARRDCSRPEWKDGLCNRCWRPPRLFGKDPHLFAYEPLNGYRDARDAEAPWAGREERARARGVGLAEVLAESPASGRTGGDAPRR
jgi:hypothetical protein